MCNFLPKTKDALLMINGFGNKNVELYGENLLHIINQYCEEHHIQPKSLFG